MPVDYLVTDGELTNIANAIRAKGGTSADLTFPTDFVSAIGNISAGTDVSDTTATAADVVDGKIFYAADGTQTTGTLVKHGTLYVSGATSAAATQLKFNVSSSLPDMTRIVVRCKPSSALTLTSTALTVSLYWTSSSISAVTAAGSSTTYKLTPVTSGFTVSRSASTLTINATGTAKFNTNSAVWDLFYMY